MQGLDRHSTMADGQSKPQRVETAKVVAIGVGGVGGNMLDRLAVHQSQATSVATALFSRVLAVHRNPAIFCRDHFVFSRVLSVHVL